jgi:protein-tyrosine phosphatase
MDESLRMLECAAKDGIDCIIATPHVTSGETTERLREFSDVFANLKERARRQELDVELCLGAEIYLSPDICDFVKSAPVSLDGGGRYVLVELPMYEFPPYAQSQLFSLISENVIPVLAHPERNARVIKNPEILFSFSKAGVLFQINAGSLVGSFGREVRKTAETLLTSGLCQFLASDAHSDRTRSFHLKEARAVVQKMAGESLATAIFDDNPSRIVPRKRSSENGGDE